MPKKSLYEKLFLKPGKTVRFEFLPAPFADLPAGVPTGVEVVSAERAADVLLAFIADHATLEARLAWFTAHLTPGGALWIAYRKGNKADINRDTINAFAQCLRLRGVAMIRVDEEWSALRIKGI